MSGFSIQLKESSKVKLEKILSKMGNDTTLKNSLDIIGNSYRKEVDMIFDRKQVRDPSFRWKPLAQSTKIAKEKKYKNKGILVATGRLKKSMTKKGHKDNISKVKNLSATFGSRTPYGIFHDEIGSTRNKLPLRNFSQPSNSSFGAWRETIFEDIERQFVNVGMDRFK